MKKGIFIFLAGAFSLFFFAPAEANHRNYACSTYDGLSVNANYAAQRPQAYPNNGCTAARPVKNDKVTFLPQGNYCCMTQENSNRLNADYNRDHPSSGGGNDPRPPVAPSPGEENIAPAQCTQQGGACQAQCNGPSASVPGGQEFLGWCSSSSGGQRLGCCRNRTTTATTTCASPNTCVNSASGCPASAQYNVSSTTPCTEPGRICCSASNPNAGGGNGGGGGGSTTTTPSTPVNITITNPLRYDTVEGVLTSVMNGIKGIVVVLALLMIVIGGIMYILSFGNPENMKRAKNVIIAALVGLAIVIAAPAFLREISALLGWDNAPPIEGGTQYTLTQIARNILNFLLSIIGILALITMVISGIWYLTSGGNENRMKQAKSMFIASLIGITVAMASLILVSAVARFFG